MDLSTNAGIISDAMKFVTKKQEQIDTLYKLDEKIDAIEEERKKCYYKRRILIQIPGMLLSYSFKPPTISAHIVSA